MEEKTPMSLLTTYDDLCRTAAVLTDGTAEQKFLKFVRSRENWRERWEAEQVGAQQLREELSRAQQEISGLEHKLQQARTLLDRELQARKAAEAKRDHAAVMWAEFMNFVEDHNAEMAEGTLDKVRRMQQQQGRLNYGLLEEAGGYSRVLSPGLTSEAAYLHRPNPETHTTEHSVLDVEDLSFDETLGLCSEPRTRASGVDNPGGNEQGGSGKKRKSILMNLEEVSRKKGRRSNVEINEVVEIKEITPRAERRESNSKNLKIVVPQKENHEINDVNEVANNNPTAGSAQEHIFEEKTNLKSTQCEACKKRIKFESVTKMSASSTPRTPLRSLQPGSGDSLTTTPGGVVMDIVLTPALRPPPRSAGNSATPRSPKTPAAIEEKLQAAGARREEILKLRKENIEEKLALVQEKKETIIQEKASKTKEELDQKLKACEENKNMVIQKTKEEVQAHLMKVQEKVKLLEITQESEKIVKKLELEENLMKVGEKRNDQLEKKIKDIQSHVDYVKCVNAAQEMKRQTYLSQLTESLNIKGNKASKLQASKEDEQRAKAEERNRKAEKVRLNKSKVAEDGENLVPESA